MQPILGLWDVKVVRADGTIEERTVKNIVTRAIGLDGQLRVSIRSFSVVEGDRYLLCSDGLSGPVPASIVRSAPGATAERFP